MGCESTVKFLNVEHSDALDEKIREKIAQLEHLFPHLQSCSVTVELPHKHQHQGALYEVRIVVAVPGTELVVSHQPNEDAYVALRDGFDSARRKLQDFETARRQKHAG
jgi:ribosomal subunit interface protein